MCHRQILRYLSTTLFLFVLLNRLHAREIKGWGSIEKVVPSYFNISTQNVLRCGNLCQKQGRCAAVTFDQRERHCYMHDARHTDTLTISETNRNRRYIIKVVSEQSHEVHIITKDTGSSDRDMKAIINSSAPSIEEKLLRYAQTLQRHKPQSMTPIIGTSSSHRLRGRLQKYKDNPQHHDAESTCNKETQLVIPSARYTNGACVDILATDVACLSHTGYQFDKQLGLCYRVEGTKKADGNEARSICEGDGGHLVRIKSQEMNDFVVNLVNIAKYQHIERFFIDGSDSETENEWKYSNGEKIIWSDWRSGCPNIDQADNCVELFSPSNFEWVDVECGSPSKIGGYVCEIDM